jgi:hypothetical protein
LFEEIEDLVAAKEKIPQLRDRLSLQCVEPGCDRRNFHLPGGAGPNHIVNF